MNPERHIHIDFLKNLRDIGGYATRSGDRVAWRRVYRSGEPRHDTCADVKYLVERTGLACVLDLRHEMEIRPERVELLTGNGLRYHNVSLINGSGPQDTERDFFTRFTNMGEFYLTWLQDEIFSRRIIDALGIIAEMENHPVLFHCTVGKDRTGILAAFVLSILGVPDSDIIADYAMTGPSMAEFVCRMKADPKAALFVDHLPAYFWEAAPQSMELLLGQVRQQYGSVRGFLETHGADAGMFRQLEDALLE